MIIKKRRNKFWRKSLKKSKVLKIRHANLKLLVTLLIKEPLIH